VLANDDGHSGMVCSEQGSAEMNQHSQIRDD